MKKVKAIDLYKILDDINWEHYEAHAKAMAKATVDKTPVAGGSLRGSITLSVGSPNVQYGKRDKTGSATKAKIDNVKIDKGDKVYVTAGAPYSLYVEQGSSTQAPNGFMRLTVAEANAISAKVARKL